MTGRSGVAGALDAAAAAKGREALRQTDAALVPEVAAILRRHHAGRPDIWMEEVLRLDPALLPPSLAERDVAWAQGRLADFAWSLAANPEDALYARRFCRRGVEDIHGLADDRKTETLSRLYAGAYAGAASLPPPPSCFDRRYAGLDPSEPFRCARLAVNWLFRQARMAAAARC